MDVETALAQRNCQGDYLTLGLQEYFKLNGAQKPSSAVQFCGMVAEL